MIDIHSHLIPGVDDGAKTLEDSVEMIKDLEKMGFSDLIITPHYIADTAYTSPRQTNRLLLAKLQGRLRDPDSKVKIYVGNEIYIDRRIEDLVNDYKIAPMADSKYLLIELPMSGEYDDYENILISLILRGYRVILAHPERYRSFQKNPKPLRYLFENGVMFQCNFGSLVGQYGKKPKKLVKKLIKADMVYTFSTDLHHKSQEIYINKSLKKLSKYYKKSDLDLILDKNPRQILNSMIK